MAMRLVVLGSGQDGGSPQFGHVSGTGPARTASSVAVLGDEAAILLDASPDLRTQFSHLAPWVSDRDVRRPFDAVFVTHAHMGHYAGLLHFGKEAAATVATPLIGPPSVLSFLGTNEPWRSLFTDGHLTPRPADGPIEINGVTVRALAVPHRSEFSSAVAYSVLVDGEPWALYLPDIDAWDPWDDAEATIAAHQVCLLDATFGVSDEVPGRNLAEIPHPLVTDTIGRFAHLASGRRIILTHMNHTNPLADPASELAMEAVAAGFEIAFDGMAIEHRAIT